MKHLKFILCVLAFIVASATCQAVTFEADIQPPGIELAVDTPTEMSTFTCDQVVFSMSDVEAAQYNALLRTGLYFQELRTVVGSNDKQALYRLWERHVAHDPDKRHRLAQRADAYRRARDGLRRGNDM